MLRIRTLRRGRCYQVVRRALAEGCLRPGFRVVEFSVQNTHIHLICEADHRTALSRGLQGLFIRMAKALNRELGRKGRVFADRYHDHVLKTPSKVRNALAYVLNNARRHAAQRGRAYGGRWVDPCSSAPDFRYWTGLGRRRPPPGNDPPLPRARCWLLRKGWQRAGPVRVSEVPGEITL
jgi:REP element-mobilizing transposase RayT